MTKQAAEPQPDTAVTGIDRERNARSVRFVFTKVPFVREVGLELVDASEVDVVVVRMPYSDKIDNSGKTPHGGAIATLIDSTGSAAVWNGHDYDKGVRGATVTMTVNFVGGSRQETVIATGRCVRRARDLNFVEVSVATESGRPVATGSMIYRITS